MTTQTLQALCSGNLRDPFLQFQYVELQVPHPKPPIVLSGCLSQWHQLLIPLSPVTTTACIHRALTVCQSLCYSLHMSYSSEFLKSPVVDTTLIIPIFLTYKQRFEDMNTSRFHHPTHKRWSWNLNPGGLKQEPVIFNWTPFALPAFGDTQVFPCPLTVVSHEGDSLVLSKCLPSDVIS